MTTTTWTRTTRTTRTMTKSKSRLRRRRIRIAQPATLTNSTRECSDDRSLNSVQKVLLEAVRQRPRRQVARRPVPAETRPASAVVCGPRAPGGRFPAAQKERPRCRRKQRAGQSRPGTDSLKRVQQRPPCTSSAAAGCQRDVCVCQRQDERLGNEQSKPNPRQHAVKGQIDDAETSPAAFVNKK